MPPLLAAVSEESAGAASAAEPDATSRFGSVWLASAGAGAPRVSSEVDETLSKKLEVQGHTALQPVSSPSLDLDSEKALRTSPREGSGPGHV
eukprot:CAMPEP_0170584762 /NCGR_PEP_ID=MMETSP0224-20130122/8852_1 /TAXON_ID=285029 /ORGANISM="Togula jolla, Strain CCCM 725" /LENGTH=91 /DNA_ID=CAMNT_0010908199 /DNA_START=325 /DNA_END=598 /DNA_ORIENTATION=+